MQQKVRKKSGFKAYFQYSQSKITGAIKIWSLKSLSILNCESRTSLHVVQYKWQPSSPVIFVSYYFKNGWPRQFFLMLCGTASLVLFLACS